MNISRMAPSTRQRHETKVLIASNDEKVLCDEEESSFRVRESWKSRQLGRVPQDDQFVFAVDFCKRRSYIKLP